MRSYLLQPAPPVPRTSRVLAFALVLATTMATATATAATASAAAPAPPTPKPARPPVQTVGVLAQLTGPDGCLVDRSARAHGCQPVRALQGPAPFLGSEAVAISPDGRNVYIASSRSNASASFRCRHGA